MRELLKRLQQRAERLTKAVGTNDRAELNHKTALAAWNAETHHTQTSALTLFKTESALDDAQEEVLAAARAFMNTAALFLLGLDADAFADLRQQLRHLREGFDLEAEAFRTYGSAFQPDSLNALETWNSAKADVITRAKPLIWTIAKAFSTADEGTITTDLDDDEPEWKSAATPEERDRIIYENRKKTLGAKAAGIKTFAIPRAIDKRRGQV